MQRKFSEAFFLAEIFEKASFDPYNFRITILLARKSEQMKNFQGTKICLYVLFITKIRSTILCLRGYKLYSQWVTLIKLKRFQMVRSAIFRKLMQTIYSCHFYNRRKRRQRMEGKEKAPKQVKQVQYHKPTGNNVCGNQTAERLR